MARKKKQPEITNWMMCPFCNREVAIVEVAPDSQGAPHYQVRSVHGWSSRLFTSRDFAENWLKMRGGEMIEPPAPKVTGMKTPDEREMQDEAPGVLEFEPDEEAGELITK
jgi:hypothetical protein